MKLLNKKAVVMSGSKGIGRSIALELKKIIKNVSITSSKNLDTSDIDQVKKFIKDVKKTDILILNTGGPPNKDFFKISEDEWKKYYNQLFLSFILILQNLKINKNGYVFLISSAVIKEPSENLILSGPYRLAFSSLFKSYSKLVAKHNISCINIAPGPIKTRRLKSLVKNLKEFEKKLPMKRAGEPDEIGKFVSTVISNKIKYLSGVTINFDGSLSNSLF